MRGDAGEREKTWRRVSGGWPAEKTGASSALVDQRRADFVDSVQFFGMIEPDRDHNREVSCFLGSHAVHSSTTRPNQHPTRNMPYPPTPTV
jgi:hypothetical protein